MGQILANKERQMSDDRHLQEEKCKESRKELSVVRNNVKGLNLRPERLSVCSLQVVGFPGYR